MNITLNQILNGLKKDLGKEDLNIAFADEIHVGVSKTLSDLDKMGRAMFKEDIKTMRKLDRRVARMACYLPTFEIEKDLGEGTIGLFNSKVRGKETLFLASLSFDPRNNLVSQEAYTNSLSGSFQPSRGGLCSMILANPFPTVGQARIMLKAYRAGIVDRIMANADTNTHLHTEMNEVRADKTHVLPSTVTGRWYFNYRTFNRYGFWDVNLSIDDNLEAILTHYVESGGEPFWVLNNAVTRALSSEIDNGLRSLVVRDVNLLVSNDRRATNDLADLLTLYSPIFTYGKVDAYNNTFGMGHIDEISNCHVNGAYNTTLVVHSLVYYATQLKKGVSRWLLSNNVLSANTLYLRAYNPLPVFPSEAPCLRSGLPVYDNFEALYNDFFTGAQGFNSVHTFNECYSNSYDFMVDTRQMHVMTTIAKTVNSEEEMLNKARMLAYTIITLCKLHRVQVANRHNTLNLKDSVWRVTNNRSWFTGVLGKFYQGGPENKKSLFPSAITRPAIVKRKGQLPNFFEFTQANYSANPYAN